MGRNCSVALARKFLPLIFKTQIYSLAPIQWRGGQVQEIFKGGSSSFVENYRDVLLGDYGAKVYMRGLRRDAKGFLQAVYLDSQYGAGVKGGGVHRCVRRVCVHV
eukprot:3103743-Karenia_brevis.AAC.1